MSGNPGIPIRHHIIALKAPTAAAGSSTVALRLLHELQSQDHSGKPHGTLPEAGPAAAAADDARLGTSYNGTADEHFARTAAGREPSGPSSSSGRLASPESAQPGGLAMHPVTGTIHVWTS